jgi:hypothetical protein
VVICEHASQATFSLGYMYEFGLGTPQDFPLSKRYYDLTLTMEKDAYLPVKLTLLRWYFHRLYLAIERGDYRTQGWKSVIFPDSTSSTVAASDPQLSSSQTPDDGFITLFGRKLYVDDILIAILCGFFASLVQIYLMRRRRRLQ